MTALYSSVDAERRELEVVVAAFERAPRLAKLLSYLGEKYFAGEAAQLTEYNIATEVFDRKTTAFVASEDAVARVEAHRLRKRLKAYYSAEGKTHPIQITIPAGTYAPVFCKCKTAAADEPDAATSPAVPVLDVRMESASDEPLEQPSTEAVPPSEDGGGAADRPAGRTLPRGRIWLYGAAVLVLAIGVGVYAGFWHHATVGAVSSPGRDIVPQPAARQVRPDVAQVPLRMILGYSGPSIRDSAGDVWQSDRYSHNGWSVQQPNVFIARTSDPLIFHYGRSGDFDYNIPLAPGNYELHFYSINAVANARLEDDQNQSVFNVTVNGKLALQDFDPLSDAMGINVASERVLRDISPAADGTLHIQVTTVIGTPSVSAIAVLRGTPHKQLPIRIVMQPNPWTDTNGQLWHPDTYFQGGRRLSHSLPGELSAEAGLYSSERFGHFSYAIPVDTRGHYTVVLHFAELHFGVEDGGVGGVGSRVFRVLCNGSTLLDDFDVFREAGAGHPLTKTFHHLKPSAQGKLNLTFEPIVNYATLSALEVVEESE